MDDAVLAVDTLVDMVCDCFLGWWSSSKIEPDGRSRQARFIALWQEQALQNEHRSEQINAMVNIMDAGTRQWWERKRDLVLDGIALRRKQT